MKHKTLILSFLLIISFCFGQNDHLEPTKDFSQYDDVRKAYYENLFILLYSGFSEKPNVLYTSRPSFSAEYAFSVEKTGNKNYIILNKLSENYWYASDRKSVKIITNKIKINNDLYLKIGELFELFIDQTKEKERIFETLPDGRVLEHLTVIVDGTGYSFSITGKNGEIRTGITQSPHPRNKPMLSRFVKICDDLCKIKTSKNIFQKNIFKEIELLINDIKKNESQPI